MTDAPSPDVETVLARHVPSETTDIHDEPICTVCGMRDSWPCAPVRLAAALRGAGLPEPNGTVEWGVRYDLKGYGPDVAECADEATARAIASGQVTAMENGGTVVWRTRRPAVVTDWQEATP